MKEIAIVGYQQTDCVSDAGATNEVELIMPVLVAAPEIRMERTLSFGRGKAVARLLPTPRSLTVHVTVPKCATPS